MVSVFFSKVRNRMILYMLTMFHQCLVSKYLKLKNVPALALSDVKGNKNVKWSRNSFTNKVKNTYKLQKMKLIELFLPSISRLFLFFCYHLVYSGVPSKQPLKKFFVVVLWLMLEITLSCSIIFLQKIVILKCMDSQNWN